MALPEQTVTVRTTSRDADAGVAPCLSFVLWADTPGEMPSRHSLAHVKEVFIGRGERMATRNASVLQLRFPDPQMSSQHARLSHAAGAWLLVDDRSKNGTFVNGIRTDSAELHDGDVIELGHTFWLFRASVSGGAETPLDREGNLLGGARLPKMSTMAATMAAKLSDLLRVAPSAAPIVLLGESGTGKEVAARAAHESSGRSGRFVPVNCAAIPEGLIEAALFGHVKGAFTHAVADADGLVRAADRGTLFLDEIADLPPSAQPKFLRVLEQHAVTPVGATRAHQVDLRVIVATHRDLADQVARGEFREDLWARLAGLVIRLPPLRERREDLGHLAATLLASPQLSFSRHAARALMTHDWPRNIRQLERAMEIARSLCVDSQVVELAHLPEELATADPGGDDEGTGGDPRSHERARRRAELVDLLRAHDGNVSAAARAYGCQRQQLQRWLREFEIDRNAIAEIATITRR